MKIRILGSGREVGKSAILIEEGEGRLIKEGGVIKKWRRKSGGKNKIVLDYGMKIQPEPPSYPLICGADAALLTHAHLDHSGGVPILEVRKKTPVYMTDLTLELTAMLVRDSMKIAKKQKYPVPYTINDLKRLIRNTKFADYGENFRVGSILCRFYDAGHVPGSAGVLLDGGKRIFYTGDIQTVESNLLHKCHLPQRADVLITESTYWFKNHPDRREEIKKVLESVEDTIANNGRVVFPVFAVGRSQEMLLILEKYADVVAFDGMGKLASEIICDYSKRIKDVKRFRKVLNKVSIIHDYKEREIAAKKFPIVVSTAGMMTGGPVVHYLQAISRDKASKVIFTGFLIPRTPGRRLMETGRFDNGSEKFDVSCIREQFDLSAHTDRRGLLGIIKKLGPELVIAVHGEKTEQFAKDVRNEFGIEAVAPRNGQVINV